MNKIQHIYKKLIQVYGPQGWWPLVNHKGCNPTKAGSIHGYHPGDYSFPKTEDQKFEICIGAILTQNTAWPNVEKALINLNKLNAFNPGRLLKLKEAELKKAIKPAGYFNQKAAYVREFAKFFLSLKGKTPSREQVLSVRGIGNETADSIMLYAYKELHFVVDAYLRKIFSHLKIINEKDNYLKIKELFEKNLPKDLVVYQEYHALINEHAKWHYKKKPYGEKDFLKH